MDIRQYFNPLKKSKSASSSSTTDKAPKKKKSEETSKTSDNKKVIDPASYFSKPIEKKKATSVKKAPINVIDLDDEIPKEKKNEKVEMIKSRHFSKKNQIEEVEDDDKKVKKAKIVKDNDKKMDKKEIKKEAKKDTKSKVKKEEKKSIPKEEPKDDTEQAEEKPKKKFNYREYLAKRSAGPKAPGSKVIPKGAPDCLLGKTFVFTGDLSSISRDEATDLVKRYGGRVTTAPSSRTTYLVVGDDPGESKLRKAKQHNIKNINEDELLELIGSSLKDKGNDDDDAMIIDDDDEKEEKKKITKSKSKEELKKGEEKDTEKKEEYKPSIMFNRKRNLLQKSNDDIAVKHKRVSDPRMELNSMDIDKSSKPQELLWVDKYKPTSLDEVIGNKTNIEKTRAWLRDWKTGMIFQKKDSPKAILYSGPPGIGKTTTAYLCAVAEGFKPIEFNASDTRSKNNLKQSLSDLVGNHTMTEFFRNTNNKKNNNVMMKRNVIIMDEVDGMSSGDRGGNAELIQMIKKTKTPIICICNDRQSPKIRTLANYTLDLRFRRPDAAAIMRRIAPICQKEGLSIQTNAVEQIIQSTQSDIRQVLNSLATYRLNNSKMSYDDGKELAKKSEKDFAQNPFSLVQKFFNFSDYRNSTFADRMDYFFEDYELMPLMIQENYLLVNPSSARDQGRRSVKGLNLISQAADSISYGDIVNKSLRSTNNWSLLSVQGAFSCARPAFFMHGQMTSQYNFPSWLGQNSKSGKFSRNLHEIHSHICQKITASAEEVRQEYIPALTNSLCKPLVEKGVDAIPEIIEVMDSYYLSKDDFDIIMEMGIGEKSGEVLMKKVNPNTKRTFTRLYNKESHPTSFIAPITVNKKAKTEKVIPDSEEVVDLDDAINDDDDDENEDNEILDKKALSAAGVKAKTKPTKGKAKSKKASDASSSSVKRKTVSRKRK